MRKIIISMALLLTVFLTSCTVFGISKPEKIQDIQKKLAAVPQNIYCLKYGNEEGVCYIYNTKARMCASEDYKKEPFCEGFDEKSQQNIFGKERNGRDNLYFNDKKNIVGLAMSGGGIRSHAFQLGILSGLFRKDETERDECRKSQEKDKKCERLLKENPILQRIGYISGVSGGAWAAGHYKAYKDNKIEVCDDRPLEHVPHVVECQDKKFFSNIEEFIKDTGEDCDDTKICLFNSYEEQAETLKKTGTLSFGLDAGYLGHDVWQDMIFKNVLHSQSIKLTDLEADPVRGKRPLLVINATHGATTIFLPPVIEHHFPFEFTSKHVGTIVDSGNIDEAYENDYGVRKGDQESYKGVFFYGEALRNMLFTLDQILAMSGAVTPPSYIGTGLFVWDFELDKDNIFGIEEQSPMARKNYIISDGGHSENLGALPLIERDLDLVIISDAAHDPEYKFGDLAALKQHALKLLGKQVDVDVDSTQGFKYARGREIVEECEGEMYGRLQQWHLEDLLSLPNKDRIMFLNQLIDDAPDLYDSVIKVSLSKDKNTNNNKAKDENLKYCEMKVKKMEIEKDRKIREMVKMTAEYRKKASEGYQKWTVGRLNERILNILLRDISLDDDAYKSLDKNDECRATLEKTRTTYDEGEECRKALKDNNRTSGGLFKLDKHDINIVKGTYRKYVKGNVPGPKNKTIIYVRANKDIKQSDEFKNYLRRNEDYLKLWTYLQYSKLNFPQDSTFVRSYEKKLIKAYYVLGKYLGERLYDSINLAIEEM